MFVVIESNSGNLKTRRSEGFADNSLRDDSRWWNAAAISAVCNYLLGSLAVDWFVGL